MRLPKLLRLQNELHGQYTFFFTVTILELLLVWTFYYILLLRSSDNSVWIVALDYISVVFGQTLGYLMTSVVMSRFGYLKLYRLSSAILALSTLLILLFMNQILTVFVALSLFRGFGHGIFWSVHNVISLREYQEHSRSNALSTNLGIGHLLDIVIPVLAASLITAEGYGWIFVLGAAVYVVAAIYPWKFNKVPRDALSVADIVKGTRQPKFRSWARIVLVGGVTESTRSIVFLVLPFLLIGEELGVGILLTSMAIIGTLFIFMHRNDNLEIKMKYGFIGAFIVACSNIILLIFWNLPALIIRQLLVKLGLAFFDPAAASIEYHNRQALLGDFLNSDAVEMQTISELLLFISRVGTILVFIFCYFLLRFDQHLILQIFLAISLFRELWILYLNQKLQYQLLR